MFDNKTKVMLFIVAVVVAAMVLQLVISTDNSTILGGIEQLNQLHVSR